MKTKHTTGNWYVTHTDTGECVIEHDERDAVIATINDVPESARTEDENKANAKLIAASPKLLEACQYVVRWHREHDSGEGELFGQDFVTTCIAAIAKATGE